MKNKAEHFVEDSGNGIYQELQLLPDGKVKTTNIDYEIYNVECMKEFKGLFE